MPSRCARGRVAVVVRNGTGGAPRSWPPTTTSSDLVFVSGQLALDGQGNVVGPGDWDVQARQCLQRIEWELHQHGAGMEDVVRLTCYLVDAAGYSAYARARLELYPNLQAAGTSVVVAGLLVEGALLELEATAVRPSPVPESGGRP